MFFASSRVSPTAPVLLTCKTELSHRKTQKASNFITINKSGDGVKSFQAVLALAPLEQLNQDGKFRVQQTYQGIKVYGSQVIYHVKNNEIIDFS